MDLAPECLSCNTKMLYSEKHDDYYCPECYLIISKEEAGFDNGKED